jgi:hypothetical protein
VKGIRWKWIILRPNVPNIWLVKIGTILTKKENLALEIANF